MQGMNENLLTVADLTKQSFLDWSFVPCVVPLIACIDCAYGMLPWEHTCTSPKQDA